MKKFNISAAVFAIVSAVVFLAAVVFGLAAQDSVAPYSVIYLLFVAATIATFVFLLKGKKDGVMILPFLFLIALPLVLTQVETGTSVLNARVFYIVAIALFVTALVFATTKNAKWAAVIVLVLTVLVTFEKLAPAVNAYNAFSESANAYKEVLANTSNADILKPYSNAMFLSLAYVMGYFGMVLFGTSLVIFASGLSFAKEETAAAEVAPAEEGTEE